MQVTDRGALLAPLLHAMAADRHLVDELVAAARSRSPEVARLPEEENRRHIALLFAAGLASFQRLADPTEHDFAEATRLGADRAAQGVPIAALLRGVQAGRTRALEIAVDRGRAAGVPDDVLLEAALDFDRYVSALERHVIDGYHTAERDLARSRRDLRAAVLRRLLLGEPGDPHPAEPAELTELAGFGLYGTGRYHCLLFDVTDPAKVQPLEQRLGAGGGVFATVEGRLAGLAPRLPSGPVEAGVLAVSSPPLPLTEARTGYRLCVAALRAAARFGRRGTLGVVDLAGETALALQPQLAGLLSDALLGALDPADDFHRELAGTALAYLDHGQRLDQTAAALHVHPNTVRYRLRRLQEITGMEAEDRLTVLQTVRWWWALHTWLHRS